MKSKTVQVLQRRELENYLLDPFVIAQVLTPLAIDRTSALSPEDVAAAITDAAESLRHKIVINRVCRQIQPDRPLMEHSLRRRLANESADEKAVTAAVLERLMSQEDLQAQVNAAWEAAEADVASRAGDELLAIAPGEEILNAVFLQFAQRRYNKRDDGAIAKAMPVPPQEISALLNSFMQEEAATEEP